jgi:molybdopterin converting factor small subunit
MGAAHGTLPGSTRKGTGSAEVTVEAVAWVTRFVGGDGTSRRLFREPLRADDTARTVLRRLSARFPALAEALWNPSTGEMAEHVQVMVNDTVLGGDITLDTRLSPGDTVTLLGQFMGG